MKLLYIQLPEDANTENVCIKFAPINSSGDIYHMLAFIILSLHSHCEIPTIILAYDIKDSSGDTDAPAQGKVTTGTQCSRMIKFATMLGYEEHFLLEELVHKAGHAPVREYAMRKNLADYSYVIDHRMLTSIIGNYFLWNQPQVTSEILRRGFSKYLDTAEQQAIDDVDHYVNTALARVPRDKNLIVLHYRFSPKANKEQNMDLHFANNIVHLLSANGYQVVCIYADSRLQRYDEINGAALHLRPFFKNKDQECGFGKLYHLGLLTKLFDLNQAGKITLKCIVGNTSGTLDLAAFIGHKVLNFHKFSEAKIDYQAARLIIQSTFICILEDLESLKKMLERNPALAGDIWHRIQKHALAEIQLIYKAEHLYAVDAHGKAFNQQFVLNLWQNIKNIDMDLDLIEYIEEMSDIELILNGLPSLNIGAIEQSFKEHGGIEYSLYTTISRYIQKRWSVAEDGKPLNNLEHLYTDDEIKQLLEQKLPDNVTPVTAAEFLADPSDVLKHHLGDLVNGSAIAIPVHVNGNHWTALMITFLNGEYLGIYIDPLGNPMPQYLHALFSGIVPVQTLNIIQQTNGVDCGPLTVENLVSLSHYITNPAVNIHDLIQRPEEYLAHHHAGIDASSIRAEHFALLNQGAESTSSSTQILLTEEGQSQNDQSANTTVEEISELIGLATSTFSWLGV